MFNYCPVVVTLSLVTYFLMKQFSCSCICMCGNMVVVTVDDYSGDCIVPITYVIVSGELCSLHCFENMVANNLCRP